MNLHPIIVHFPIALLVVGFMFATLTVICKKCNQSKCLPDGKKHSCVQYAAYWLLVLGALSSVFAVLSGQFFTNPMTGPLGELRDTHQILAITTTVVSIIASSVYTYYIYKAPVKQVFVIAYSLYVVCAILVGITGHYGGEMVYMFR